MLAPIKKKRINSKNKGNKYERELAKIFRQELGLNCITSRAGSKMMDNCGVDFINVPWLGSAKNGYKNKRPKPDEIFKYIKYNIDKNFGLEDPIQSLPFFLFHKIDGKNEYNHYVSMPFSCWKKLIKAYLESIQ